MALQFANKWGCEVHAFTTSDSKEAEAHKLGAHYVHNTKQDGALKKIAGSLDAPGGVLDFRTFPHFRPLILNPATGEVVNSGG